MPESLKMRVLSGKRYNPAKPLLFGKERLKKEQKARENNSPEAANNSRNVAKNSLEHARSASEKARIRAGL